MNPELSDEGLEVLLENRYGRLNSLERSLALELRDLRREVEALKGWPDGKCDYCGESKAIHDGLPAGQAYCDRVPE